MTKDSTPALSNFLTVLAAEVAGEVAAFKRSSAAAHRAYLAAGAKLAEAREVARRGEWAPFLAACGDGLDERTAQRMMRLARSGMTPDDVTAAGGLRAALESLAAPRNPSPVTGIASPAPAPESASVADIEVPNGAARRSHVHESALAAGEHRSVQAGAPDRCPNTADWVGEPAGGISLYQWRRARGQCTVCGEPSDTARCPGCAESLNVRRRSRTRITAELAPRLEAAADAGRGVRLTAAEVARLTGRRS